MGGFCIFLRVPIEILVILAVSEILSWLIKLAVYFSVLLITSRVYCPMIKSGLAYCWCLTIRVGALPANPPSQ